MENLELNKDYKLLVEFTNIPIKHDHLLGVDLITFNGKLNYISYFVKDWNFLMMIVEKIENMTFINDGYGFNFKIENGIVDITDLLTGKIISHQNESDKNASVLFAIIEFIKWYNQNQK
jgi:hypothetical protein